MSELRNAANVSFSLALVHRRGDRGARPRLQRAFGALIIACFIAPYVIAQPLPQDQALAKIEALGGRAYRNSSGQIDIIDLTGNQVTDEHLDLLKSFPELRQLSLNGSSVTDKGLDKLLVVPNLEEVSLLKTQVTPAAAKAFNDRHPKVFHVALSPPLRPEMLGVGAVTILLLAGIGGWLIRLTLHKQAVLTPRQYAQGLGYGLLLIAVAVVVLVLGLLKLFGLGS